MPDNPHDKLFKEAFWHPPAAAELVRPSLPPEVAKRVDWPAMRRAKGQFISAWMKESRCDAVFEVPFAAEDQTRSLVLTLYIEHQSKNDNTMVFRCLQYTSGLLWEYLREKAKVDSDEPPPIIVPLVVSHDPAGWRAHLSLDEFYALDEDTERLTRELRPRFRYFVDDLSRHEDDALRARALDRYRYLVLFALRDGRKTELLELFRRQLQDLQAMAVGARGDEYMGRVLWYLFTVSKGSEITPSALADVASQAGPDSDRIAWEKVERWKEKWRVVGREQGRERGREEGCEEGLEQARRNAARLAITNTELKFGPLPDEQRERLEAAAQSVLDKWTSGLIMGQSLEQLFELLASTADSHNQPGEA